jgi:uncharacterized SAM-binding protein YcdF (DUF218 family)
MPIGIVQELKMVEEARIDDEVRRLAKVLWDYHCLDLGLRPVDFVLALGSHDERVAVAAAQHILDGLANLLVTTGGFGKVTRHIWGITEGARFAEIARSLGVPEEKILIENTATNTSENIIRTRDLLAQKGITIRSGILVTKPYMRRRAFATALKQWPEVEWLVSAPRLSMEEYSNEEVPERRMIELMVGDLQRIKIYAGHGFQAYQEIPANVWQAYEKLVKYGFDKYVIRE